VVFVGASSLPFVLVACDRLLNPKILSLTFSGQSICDVSSALTRHRRELGLALASPLFNAANSVVAASDPPNTIHYMQTSVIFLFFARYLADGTGLRDILLLLHAHIVGLLIRASNFLNNAVSKYLSMRAEMPAAGTTGPKRMTSTADPVGKKDEKRNLHSELDMSKDTMERLQSGPDAPTSDNAPGPRILRLIPWSRQDPSATRWLFLPHIPSNKCNVKRNAFGCFLAAQPDSRTRWATSIYISPA
jgi:hypothetical protein